MNSILKRIILVMVFLLPFIIFTKGFYGAVFAKSVFIEGGALLIGSLYLIGKLYKKEMGLIPKNIILLFFGLYILILLISGLNGVMPSLSFWSSYDQGTGVIFMFCLLIFTLITSSLFKKIEDWYKLFTVFAISGIIFTVGCLFAELGVKFSKVLSLSTVNGFTIGNSSWTGVYLAFVFFVSLGLMFSLNKKQKIIGILGVVTAFLNPILTGLVKQFPGMHFGPIGLAQTASYSLFVGIGFFILYLIFRKIQSAKIRKVFMGSVVSVILVGVISIAFIGLGPIKTLIAEKAGPNRLVFWEIAVKGYKDKPVLGWGGDTYQYVYGKYFNPIVIVPGERTEYWVDKSHSIYFDELATGGILGFISLMLLYGVILFGLIRRAVNDRGREGLLYMALFTGMVSFLIQGVMLFQTIIGWFIISLLIAFVANTCFKDRSKNIVVGEIIKNNKKMNSSEDTGSNILISVSIILIFCVLFNYIIIKPSKINTGLATFPIMPYNNRLEFYKKIDHAYVGNYVDLGNAFSHYHIKLRNILKQGIKDNERDMMINEIKEINLMIDNGLKRQNYMDMKLLMTATGFHSILAGIAPVSERQAYYDKGIFYVDKMTEISDKNPIRIFSKGILDASLKYGEAGVNAFETDKAKR
ncbi:MAG: hypothetical protein QG566_499 [Patescibacteria group bacterium]|nr:hypothetical protein [Patescibacteria group bacterium]